MEVVLLGSGAADGWPNAFCTCGSCQDARASGIIRAQSSVLVDDVMLIDPGAESAPAATRHGRTLAGVRHLMVTHHHADHLAPQLLLFRSWVSSEPLEVIGPPAVIEQCRDWVAPDAPVTWRVVTAGDRISVGEYRVRVLAANHRVIEPGDTVLYDLTAPDGARLLWACDTGPWGAAQIEAVAGADYDVVLMEQTFGDRTDLGTEHLNLATFARLLEQLRDVAAVSDRTQVRAVHLSHHNPPEAELAARLAEVGAAAGRDGEVLRA